MDLQTGANASADPCSRFIKFFYCYATSAECNYQLLRLPTPILRRNFQSSAEGLESATNAEDPKPAATNCFLPVLDVHRMKQIRCVYGRQMSTNNSAGGVCAEGGEGVISPIGHQMACIFEVPLEMCYKLVGMISVALLSGTDDAEQEASILRMALKPTGLTATSITQAYKKTVHSWFPVVTDDQITLFTTPSILGNCHGRDGVLLLCMALVSQQPCKHPGHDICCNLYKAAKQSFLLLQTSSKPCIQILQIGLLLSLFEYGHGLDQESKFSIAACMTICRSHKILSVSGSEDGEESVIATVCRRAVAIIDCFLFELDIYHTGQTQTAVSTADRLAMESSRRMAVDICKSMNETVLKKGVDGLSLIGLSSTCRAANLLAKTNVDLHEEGMFTRSDVEELNWALCEFAQRWRIGGK
ncbi:hypothetical protein GGI43DRAFT_424068 [Trichoderma evansii]